MLGNEVTLIGTLTADPERMKNGGAKFSIAHNAWKNGEQGDVTFFKILASFELGDHVMKSLHKGDRVIVSCEVKQFTTDEGRQFYVFSAHEVGAALRFATVDVTRIRKSRTDDEDEFEPEEVPEKPRSRRTRSETEAAPARSSRSRKADEEDAF